jgi:hypothetical protein
MNDVRTPIVVCCYRERAGTDLSVLWVACWSVFVFIFRRIYIIQQQL